MTIYPQPFKDRVREERRRTVLRAARQLFVTHGYAGTTIDAIAEAAGVGKGTVYLHFATKEDILVELVLEATDDLRRRIAELGASSLPVLDQIAASVRLCATSSQDNYDLITLNFPEMHAAVMTRLGSEPPARIVQRQIAAIVRQGQEQGALRADLDPEAVGLMVLALSHIPFSFGPSQEGVPAVADAAMQHAIAVLRRGIANGLPPPSQAGGRT